MSSSEEASPRTDRLPVEHLQGIAERVTFHSEESGYTVLRFTVPGMRELVTVIGHFPEIHAGQTLRLTGFWREHPKYGRQFQCLHSQETKPATLTGLEKYLGSGLIKGIGPMTAKRIVAHFGLETLEIIEQSCPRLIEVPGIGERRVTMIERAWVAQKAIKEVMLFLRGHDVQVNVHAILGTSRQKGRGCLSVRGHQCSTTVKAKQARPFTSLPLLRGLDRSCSLHQ